MTIRFRCPCGAFLHADEKFVDSIKPCPHCHANLRIPHAASQVRECIACHQAIPSGHTIWARGRRVCWKCMPPGSVRIDMKTFQEHRQLQIATLRKAKAQGLGYFQYHAPYDGAPNEIQETADELIFSVKDWDRITPAWRELGLIPFDMGTFMAVSLNVERFNQQADESRRYHEPLLAFVKIADEMPMASIPKDAGGSAMVAAPAAEPSRS